MSRFNDKVWQVLVEVTCRPEVPAERVKDLVLSGANIKRVSLHQYDDLSYAKIEVLTVRPDTKWRIK